MIHKRGLETAVITARILLKRHRTRADDISMLLPGILSRTFNGAFTFLKHNGVLVRLHFGS